MNTAVSPDGTKIAYDRQGHGPAVILIDGAMCTRDAGAKPELVRLLAQHFTVFSYDRRGRGDSGDTSPYAVEREIEDIETLIDEGGGTASLFGHSSGAALALEAALALDRKVTGLALYDAPFNDDPGARRAWQEYLGQLSSALADGRHGDAVAAFMSYVGMPAGQISGMRQAPFWPGHGGHRAHAGLRPHRDLGRRLGAHRARGARRRAHAGPARHRGLPVHGGHGPDPGPGDPGSGGPRA